MRDDMDDLIAHGDMERKRKREDAMFPPSRTQVVFNWLMDDPEWATRRDGYWSTSDDVAKVEALLKVLDTLAPSPEATSFWPIGFINNDGGITYELGREPRPEQGGKLIYIARSTPQGERP